MVKVATAAFGSTGVSWVSLLSKSREARSPQILNKWLHKYFDSTFL